MKSLKWRFLLVLVVVLISVVYLIPSISPSLPSWWKGFLPREKLHLGLDLQGGMHLILEVQTDEAVKSTVDRMAEDVKDAFREEGIPFFEISRSGLEGLVLKLPADAPQDKVAEVLNNRFPTLLEQKRETIDDQVVLYLALDGKEVDHIKKLAARQALETIRNRIDQFGVTEPDIRPQGEDRILVQLPGVKDPERALNIIGKTARLEFKLVDERVTPEEIRSGKLPPGSRVYPMKRFDPNTKRTYQTTIVLRDRTLLTGEYITDARVRIDPQFNRPYVALEFDPQGARIFERITGEHVKERLAIVLDGVVYSAPVIQEKISGGHASITGSFTMEEARDLAIVLRAGALPAPVKILEERTVGPSLGRDSIRMGLIAMLVGGAVVLLFMPLYYKLSGLIADISLCLNILLIMAGLAAFQATLTLPGIAGIILTIGMAVDANVLIFERIREELRLGKTPKAAVSTGYSRATLTILDANITTLIAAVVLFQFGTGPVRGFAVTLSMGIVASMFTAIIFTRIVFDYLLGTRRAAVLSI
ncbi:protein translocase subunit SecD [Thermodesulforhabdus norvegica]|uniref:Protein translocase subunit SecD n=1 Tax=Thermodesulforhabdus norvegica TaxID=39841 RepID=A0A1I4UVE9_9BACT|nr:protein translocase subunit SecD [Thermodesulforhabdus norvegica]SFM92997.1 preprotein translocase subunit SecD [Thermodesulforhabdus norvegica]